MHKSHERAEDGCRSQPPSPRRQWGGRAAAMRAVGLLTACLLAGAAGCGETTERMPLTSADQVPKRSLEYTRDMIRSNARHWMSLQAACQVTIVNPQIPRPGNRVTLTNGRLTYQKPGKIHLAVPDSDQPRIELVGDGRSYRVRMRLFDDSYSGAYDDPIADQPGRIHFLPADLVDALDPMHVLARRALTLTQQQKFSTLHCLEFVSEPEPSVRYASSLTVDRSRRGRVLAIEKFNQDGSAKVRMSYPRSETVAGVEDYPVTVPGAVLMVYPAEQTTIQVLLRGISLNV
ncbi:MAG: hypothetical protein ACYS1C_11070, partial [Planctomycetota bacterium]